MIRVQILRYRDLEYNLASRTLGTPTLKIVAKNIMPQLVSVIVTTMTQMLPSFISYEAFLSFFGLGLPIPCQVWVVLIFGLFTKRNNQCLLVLDSIDNSCLGILIPFRSWSKLSGC